MKRYLQLLALLVVASFTACDTAHFPIDNPPSVPIDKRLLGQWRVKNKHEEFTLIKNTANTYIVIYKDWRTGDLDKLDAFLSDVEGVKILNIHAKNETKDGYFFVRILDVNTTTNVVKACSVADSMLQTYTEAEDVRKHITENINNPAMYSDTTFFYRIIR